MSYVSDSHDKSSKSLDETGHVARNCGAWRMLELSSVDSAKDHKAHRRRKHENG